MKVDELHTWLSDLGLADLRDPKTPPPKPVDATGRSAQRFAIDVVARRGREHRGVTAQGRDIYAFSAPLVCEAAARLLSGRFARPGAAAPGEIFAARDFLAALKPEHLAFEIKAG